jgi:hypothetical protein
MDSMDGEIHGDTEEKDVFFCNLRVDPFDRFI